MISRAFVESLIQEKVIPTGMVNEILEAASISGDRVDTVILDLGLATEDVMLTRLGQFTMSRTVSATELMSAPRELTALIPQRLARRFGLIPFGREGKTLWVGTVDPGDLLVEDELSLLTGSMIRTFAALEIRIREGLARHYQVALPARLETLLKRLNDPESAIRHPPRSHTEREFTLTRPTTDHRVQQATPEELEEPRATVPTELEISEEELALFPSFAFGTSEAPPSSQVTTVTDPTAGGDIDPAPAEEDPGPIDLSPEARLSRAAEVLQNAEIRDDIADALLEFSRHHFERRMLLALRGDTIAGWRGEGAEVEPTAVRAIAIPRDEPSVFSGLLQGTTFWLGPLPPMARNQELTFALGSPEPVACLILPIKVKGKIVAFLYGDSRDQPLGSVPMADFKRLMAKTDIAFQVYLLKGKIRVI